MDVKRVIKNVTLFIILAFVVVIGAVYFLLTQGSGPEGVGLVFVGSAIVFIGVMLLIDILLKRIFKLKLLWVWIVEVMLLLIVIYWWIVK